MQKLKVYLDTSVISHLLQEDKKVCIWIKDTGFGRIKMRKSWFIDNIMVS